MWQFQDTQLISIAYWSAYAHLKVVNIYVNSQGEVDEKISDAEKMSGTQMSGSSNQSDCTRLVSENKGSPPEEICKDDLYFDFDSNLSHSSWNEEERTIVSMPL